MRIDIEQEEDICVLRLSGHLLAGADETFLQKKADEIKSRNCDKVLADLRELASLGSTGVGFLLGVYASVAKRPGGRFVLVGPTHLVSRVLEVTRLTSVLTIVQDMASGMAELQDKVKSQAGSSL